MARLARVIELVLADLELSVSQYRLLALLGERSEASSALAAKLAVSPPSVTAVVDGLVARGLVSRHGDEADRRRVSHQLTARGRRVLEEADAATGAELTNLAAELSKRSAERALAALDVWGAALEARRRAAAIGREKQS